MTIYTTPMCSYCKQAKEFMDENKIDYVSVDVASDSAARDKVVKETGQTEVPVFEIDGKWIIGYDKEELGELLGI